MIGGTCGTIRGKKEIHSGFWKENLKYRDHLEEVDLNETIILNGSERNRKGGCGLDLSVAQGRDSRGALFECGNEASVATVILK